MVFIAGPQPGQLDQREIPALKVANDLGDLTETEKRSQSDAFENLKQDSYQVVVGRRGLELRGPVSHSTMSVQITGGVERGGGGRSRCTGGERGREERENDAACGKQGHRH